MDKPKPVNPRLHDLAIARTRFEDLFCTRCDNLGILKVKVGEVGTLALCVCTVGRQQGWALPSIHDISQSYAIGRVPAQEFHPGVERGSLDRDEAKRFIREKALWWREKIRTAEEFWKSQKENK